MTNTPFFDGHNDTVLRIVQQGQPLDLLHADPDAHIDLPRMQGAGMVGGIFAMFSPSPANNLNFEDFVDDNGHYAIPLPERVEQADALHITLKMADELLRSEAAAEGALRIVRSYADLESCVDSASCAVLMHIEGVEAIGEDLTGLESLYAMGLRSLGPVWSRENVFASGVPFAFPSSGDTGPGLTAAGFDLLEACNHKGILVDMSHLNEKGFWDIAQHSKHPLIASHSNAYAVCPHSRNLSDEQLRAVADSGGIVGLNYAIRFLNEDGSDTQGRGLEVMVKHVQHMARQMGVEHIGLGSDFDGADIPEEIGDVCGVGRLLEALSQAGFSDSDVEAIAYKNWFRVMRDTLH